MGTISCPMARQKRPSTKGFKTGRPKPQTISDPWSTGYPWSGGESDRLIHGLRQVSYKERRVFLASQTYPRYLYKFKAVPDRDFAHLEDILIHSRLYLSSPRQFNDPFDMAAGIVATGTLGDLHAKIDRSAAVPIVDKERMRIEATKIGQFQGIQGYFERHHTPLHFRKLLDSSGVISFSSSSTKEKGSGPRNILMWSHYGNSHRGLCFQFEIAREPLLLRELVRVKYQPRYPEVNWLSPTFSDQLEGALCHKAPCWSYEHEWRFVLRECANTYLPFHPGALSAIILGCEISAKKEQIVRRLIDKRLNKGLPAPRIFRASRSQSEYAIRITR
jgi:hypothetical protein